MVITRVFISPGVFTPSCVHSPGVLTPFKCAHSPGMFIQRYTLSQVCSLPGVFTPGILTPWVCSFPQVCSLPCVFQPIAAKNALWLLTDQ